MANRGESFDPDLARAVQSHQKGALPEAERLYRTALKRNPSNGVALVNLGILFAQSGRFVDAVEQFRNAVAADPNAFDKRIFLANALKDAGAATEAIEQYREAARLSPRAAQGHFLLGNALLRLGNAEEAVPAYRSAAELEPRNPDILMNFGIALHQMGAIEEAIRRYKQVIQIQPKSGRAWLCLGDSYVAAGEFEAAVSAFQSGLAMGPRDAAGYASLSEALTALGDYETALEAVGKALQLDAHDPKALFQRAQILQLQKKSAAAAEGYKELLSRSPDQSAARFNLGIVLGEQSYTEEAKQEFMILADKTGDSAAAAARIRAALLVPIIADSSRQISEVRGQMLQDIRTLRKEPPTLVDPQFQVGNPAFYLAYQGGNNRELMQEIAGMFIAATPDLVMTAGHCGTGHEPGSRLKIAFISAHLREHTVGRITAGLIKHLDRAQFEVIVMRPAGTSDAYSLEIDAMADQVNELPVDFRLAREVVAEHRLDAIYYPDIGMEPFTYFLAFSRLAPVQAVGWGHADTTGIPNVDTFLSSVHFEPQNAQDQYSERLVLLPRINCFYPRPDSEFEPVARAELSLPENVPLYMCPQSAFKLHPDIDEALDELLRLDPKGIVAISSGTEPHWNELLLHRFKRRMPDRFERIQFIPRVPPEKFRGLLALADGLIDPKHFTGGHTTYMAFAGGTPVITWEGSHMRGRMTRGLYEQMGMKGPVARDAGEFARLAVRLANDTDWRKSLCEELKAKSADLFEDMQAVRDFENALIAAYEGL